MARGDGRLTHDLLPGEKGPQDACGVFGVWAPGEEVAKLTYYGLYALQHRGQESAGIATSRRPRDPGLQGHGAGLPGLRRALARSLRGHLAVGHCRYSTTGGSHLGERPAHPRRRHAGTVALAHNGNLTNSAELRDRSSPSDGRRLPAPRRRAARAATPPTPPWSPRCSPTTPTAPSRPPRSTSCPSCAAPSASSSWTSTRCTPRATRRASVPLVLGRLERGWVVASRDRGARHRRRLADPRGRARRADRDRRGRPAHAAVRRGRAQGLRLRVRLPGPPRHHDQRPRRARGPGRDGPHAGPRAPGRGRPGHPDARVGHAGRDRLRPGVRHPLRPGAGQELLRRAHLHRPVARPSASSASGSSSTRCRTSSRASGWSSSTTRSCAATPSARWSGCCARPARPRCTCASPRRRCSWPCFYGIDFATRAELIATGLGGRGGPRQRSAPTPSGYISEDGMVAATEQPRDRLCTACFTGIYPIELPDATGSARTSSSCRWTSTARRPATRRRRCGRGDRPRPRRDGVTRMAGGRPTRSPDPDATDRRPGPPPGPRPRRRARGRRTA